MKHLNFAIASLVDAQTGLNLSGNSQANYHSNRRPYSKTIETKSLGEIIKSTVIKTMTAITEWNQEQKNKIEILSLNERQLQDIGIESNEVNQLRAGVITTDKLKRSQGLLQKSPALRLCATAKIQKPATFPANQPDYRLSKLA